MRLLRPALLAACGLLLCGEGPSPRALAIEGVLQSPVNGHWYKRYSEVVTWQQARAHAAALGGHLATVTSAAEDQWIAANLSPGAAWLGATDEAKEGTWAWVTGEPWAYANWQPGQPDDDGGSGDYLEYQAGSAKWYDAPANDPNGYLVEWEDDPNGIPPPDAPAAPSDLVVSVSPGGPIVVQWKDNSDNEAYFELERRTATSAYVRIARPAENGIRFEDYSAEPGEEHTYRVRARNLGGASFYSNEGSATASYIPAPPLAPSDLVVTGVAETSIRIEWIDNCVDEIGVEIHRGVAGAPIVYLATLGPDSTTHLDAGIAPDTRYVYAVRAVNAVGVSSFVQVEAETLPTLAVSVIRADLRDSRRFGRDSARFVASFEPGGASDGVGSPFAEGFAARVGADAAPGALRLPPGLDGWREKGGRWTWRSPPGAAPRYRIRVDPVARLVSVAASGLEFGSPPANPMRASFAVGDDAGTARGDWETGRPGIFRVR